jgi:hypothetical protein
MHCKSLHSVIFKQRGPVRTIPAETGVRQVLFQLSNDNENEVISMEIVREDAFTLGGG